MSKSFVVDDHESQVAAGCGGAYAQAETRCLDWLWRTLYSSDGTSAVCIRCGGVRKFHRVRGRRAYACDRCGAHVHPTKGTFLEGSKLGLAVWFDAAPLVVQSGGTLSAARLAERLGVTQRTAARVKRALLTAQASGGPDAALLQMMLGRRPSVGACRVQGAAGTCTLPDRRSPMIERITRAACRAFAERGVARTRVSDIARSAGVSTAIIHYYFRSKDRVLLAALRWASERQGEWEREILAGEPDHVARVRALVQMAVPRRQVPRDEYRLWLEMYMAGIAQPALLEECVGLSERWRRFIEQVIEEGAAAGVFRPVAPAGEISHRLVNLFDGFGFRLAVGYATTPYELANELTRRFVAEQLGISADDL